MQYVNLGRTGLKVSRLCLGTMNFGPQTSEADSVRASWTARSTSAINFFDTANVYGWKKGEGVTEQIVGRWFAQGGGRREQVVLATKVYGRHGRRGPTTVGLSALHIRRACEASLRRLQTDYIDLYQMHHVDRDTPWDEIWQAMEMLVQQGKVLYVGSSNFAGWHIAQAQRGGEARHFLGLVSEQSLYNLHRPHHRARGAARVPSITASASSPGARWGAACWAACCRRRRRAARGVRKVQKDRIDRASPAARKWENVLQAFGQQPADVALAWMLAHPPSQPRSSARARWSSFEGSLRALEINLDESTMKTLDEIFPGPGRRRRRLFVVMGEEEARSQKPEKFSRSLFWLLASGSCPFTALPTRSARYRILPRASS